MSALEDEITQLRSSLSVLQYQQQQHHLQSIGRASTMEGGGAGQEGQDGTNEGIIDLNVNEAVTEARTYAKQFLG